MRVRARASERACVRLCACSCVCARACVCMWAQADVSRSKSSIPDVSEVQSQVCMRVCENWCVSVCLSLSVLLCLRSVCLRFCARVRASGGRAYAPTAAPAATPLATLARLRVLQGIVRKTSGFWRWCCSQHRKAVANASDHNSQQGSSAVGFRVEDSGFVV